MGLSKGYVQIYTGDGKGKTTASLGLALRAAGAGLKVYIGQFLKSGDYSEIQALKALGDRVTVVQFGSGKLIRGQPDDADIAGAALDVGRATDQKPSLDIARRNDVIASPHIAGLTPEALDHQALETVRQAAAIIRGEIPPGAVNADAATRLARLR